MKTLVIALFTVSLFAVAGCSKEEPKTETQKPVMQTETKPAAVDSSIIRNNNVDVATIDLNKDGKVYQCPMDYQVISDKPGTCPLCKMNLEEVSVVQASKNLK